VIAQSFAGIYEDVAASVFENEQSSWVSILEGLTTPYQPTYKKQETAANSKPKSQPTQPSTPPEEPKAELVQQLPGGGPF
jgi:hypothetical protein